MPRDTQPLEDGPLGGPSDRAAFIEATSWISASPPHEPHAEAKPKLPSSNHQLQPAVHKDGKLIRERIGKAFPPRGLEVKTKLEGERTYYTILVTFPKTGQSMFTFSVLHSHMNTDEFLNREYEPILLPSRLPILAIFAMRLETAYDFYKEADKNKLDAFAKKAKDYLEFLQKRGKTNIDLQTALEHPHHFVVASDEVTFKQAQSQGLAFVVN